MGAGVRKQLGPIRPLRCNPASCVDDRAARRHAAQSGRRAARAPPSSTLPFARLRVQVGAGGAGGRAGDAVGAGGAGGRPGGGRRFRRRSPSGGPCRSCTSLAPSRCRRRRRRRMVMSSEKAVVVAAASTNRTWLARRRASGPSGSRASRRPPAGVGGTITTSRPCSRTSASSAVRSLPWNSARLAGRSSLSTRATPRARARGRSGRGRGGRGARQGRRARRGRLLQRLRLQRGAPRRWRSPAPPRRCRISSAVLALRQHGARLASSISSLNT
jgi:hypothetical protein